MQKSKIYLLFAVSTLVLCGSLLYLLQIDMKDSAMIAVAMFAVLAAPVFIVNIMLIYLIYKDKKK